MLESAAARTAMVDSQLRTDKVKDPGVLAAFEAIPREVFVPKPLMGLAYVDEDLPLGRGRFVIEPRVLARLLQAGEIGSEDAVLEIGTGSGYGAAIIGQLAASVVALESDAALCAQAEANMTGLELGNILLVMGPLAEGYAKQGPYDVILFSGGLHVAPPAELVNQLAPGGRLLAVVKAKDGIGRAMLYRNEGGKLVGRVLFDASVPVLPGFEAKPGFSFP